MFGSKLSSRESTVRRWCDPGDGHSICSWCTSRGCACGRQLRPFKGGSPRVNEKWLVEGSLNYSKPICPNGRLIPPISLVVDIERNTSATLPLTMPDAPTASGDNQQLQGQASDTAARKNGNDNNRTMREDAIPVTGTPGTRTPTRPIHQVRG